jgi:hypothetical protein
MYSCNVNVYNHKTLSYDDICDSNQVPRNSKKSNQLIMDLRFLCEFKIIIYNYRDNV